MKIIALSALLLFGATSVATATPQDNEPTARVSYTKDPAQAVAGDWIELATPTPCGNGRTFLTFDADQLPMKKLRFDATKGRPFIKAVKVVYADGKQRYVKLEKRLDARGQKSAYVDLRGSKQIDSIVVDTDWRVKGSFSIQGAPDRTSIATR